jgi:hypothetical protein
MKIVLLQARVTLSAFSYLMQEPVCRKLSLYLTSIRNSLHDIIKNKYVLPYLSIIPFVKSKLPHIFMAASGAAVG